MFLLKLEASSVKTELPSLVSQDSWKLIDRVANLLSRISNSPRDTPSLYCDLLRSLLRLAADPFVAKARDEAKEPTVVYASALVHSVAWKVRQDRETSYQRLTS